MKSLVPRVLLTLNVPVRMGAYDFAAHPIAPAGTLVFVHERPEVYMTWTPLCVRSFYIGSALDDYCGYLFLETLGASPTRSIGSLLLWSFRENLTLRFGRQALERPHRPPWHTAR